MVGLPTDEMSPPLVRDFVSTKRIVKVVADAFVKRRIAQVYQPRQSLPVR